MTYNRYFFTETVKKYIIKGDVDNSNYEFYYMKIINTKKKDKLLKWVFILNY